MANVQGNITVALDKRSRALLGSVAHGLQNLSVIIRRTGGPLTPVEIEAVEGCTREVGRAIREALLPQPQSSPEAEFELVLMQLVQSTEWLVHQMQGDSGTGDSYWSQHEGYRLAKRNILRARHLLQLLSRRPETNGRER